MASGFLLECNGVPTALLIFLHPQRALWLLTRSFPSIFSGKTLEVGALIRPEMRRPDHAVPKKQNKTQKLRWNCLFQQELLYIYPDLKATKRHSHVQAGKNRITCSKLQRQQWRQLLIWFPVLLSVQCKVASVLLVLIVIPPLISPFISSLHSPLKVNYL